MSSRSRRPSRRNCKTETNRLQEANLCDFAWWSSQMTGNHLDGLVQSFVDYMAKDNEGRATAQMLLAFLRTINGRLPETDPAQHLATYLLGAFQDKEDKHPDVKKLLEGARSTLRSKNTRSGLLPLTNFLKVDTAVLLEHKGPLKDRYDNDQVLVIGDVLVVRDVNSIQLTSVVQGKTFASLGAKNSVMFPIGVYLGVFNITLKKLSVYDVNTAESIREVKLSKEKPKAKNTDARPDSASSNSSETEFVECVFVKDATEDSILLTTVDAKDAVYVLTGLKYVTEPKRSKIQLIQLYESCENEENHQGFLTDNTVFYINDEKQLRIFDIDSESVKFRQASMCQVEAVGRVTPTLFGIVTYFDQAITLKMASQLEDIGVRSASEVISKEIELGKNDLDVAWISRLELGLTLLIMNSKIYWLKLSADGRVAGRGSLKLGAGVYCARANCHEFEFNDKNYLFLNSSPETCVCLTGSQLELAGQFPSFTGSVCLTEKYFAWFKDRSRQVMANVYDLSSLMHAVPTANKTGGTETPKSKVNAAYDDRDDYYPWLTRERQIQYFVDEGELDMAITQKGAKNITFMKNISVEPRDLFPIEVRFCNGNLLFVTNLDEEPSKVDLMEFDWQTNKISKVLSVEEELRSYPPIRYSSYTDCCYTTAESDKRKVMRLDIAKKRVDTFMIDKNVKFDDDFDLVFIVTKHLLLVHIDLDLLAFKFSGKSLVHHTTIKEVEGAWPGGEYFAYRMDTDDEKLFVADAHTGKQVKEIVVPSRNDRSDSAKKMIVRLLAFVGKAQLVLTCEERRSDQGMLLVYDFLVSNDSKLVLPSVQLKLGECPIRDLSGCSLGHLFGLRIDEEFTLFQLIEPDQEQTVTKRRSPGRSPSARNNRPKSRA